MKSTTYAILPPRVLAGFLAAVLLFCAGLPQASAAQISDVTFYPHAYTWTGYSEALYDTVVSHAANGDPRLRNRNALHWFPLVVLDSDAALDAFFGDAAPYLSPDQLVHVNFQEETLLVLYLDEASSNVRHRLDGVRIENGAATVEICRLLPPSSNSTPEGVILSIAIPKADLAGCSVFDAFVSRSDTDQLTQHDDAAFVATPLCESFINLRQAPDVNAVSLAQIPLGAVFLAERCENRRFAAASYGGFSGYVNLDYVLPLNQCNFQQLSLCAVNADGAASEAVADALCALFRQNPNLFCFELDQISAPPAAKQARQAAVSRLLASQGIAPAFPQLLCGIQKAVLTLGEDSITLTDPAALQALEDILTPARALGYAPMCWFTSTLTLELASGEQYAISVATDGCGVYCSRNLFFRFASENDGLYRLFGLGSGGTAS